ncbi:uncharacterized protein LOC112088070 [Eutrema salsugineum]|uniref:uncharacterized protein LOC112088070 n=1 Tax=Eutrema salsugineum TaxID=72664 RepID=UPI000CED0B7A|nr:uncharacterized protein LOC112088070 [Eutrema salsugineum]
MEMQETSEPGFPVARVVRTPASRGKTVTKVKKEPADPKEKNKSGTKSKADLKDKNEESQIINISDVSRPLQSRRVQIPSLQDEDDSAIESMKKRLEKLVEHAKNPPAEKEKRGRSLAPTQVSPYLGNSVVRRIMDPAGPPPGRYDPFEAVDSRILDNLTRYVAFEAEKQLECPYARGEFYLTLMTPKESWPRKEYGWLHDQSWLFSDGYLDVANGHYDHYLPTHKKWGTDVDFVYIAHNVNNEHWVAVEVDIPKKKIRVFDCIPDLYRKGEVEESVKPYARMIPLLLKHMAPPELKKGMKEGQFHIYMYKTAALNRQTGDCGVFTLKTIECLALCHKWDQLKDSNMPLIRMKYAAEIFDEVRVRHLLVVKPLEEIYPVWEGEPRRVDVDIKVHNMICDILDGSLDEGFWESPKNVGGDATGGASTVQTPKQSKTKLETPRVEKKKKEKVKEAEATDSTPRSKRRREREARKEEKEKKKRKKEDEEEDDDFNSPMLCLKPLHDADQSLAQVRV